MIADPAEVTEPGFGVEGATRVSVARDVNVLIFHEDPLVGAGAIAVLSGQPGIRVLASHADVTDKDRSPGMVHVVVMDIGRALSGAGRCNKTIAWQLLISVATGRRVPSETSKAVVLGWRLE